MNFLLNKRARLAAIVVGSMVAGGALTGTALAVQGHMLNARGALYRANAQLQAAEPDKGGHRVEAMRLVGEAIQQVNAGLAAGAR
jgi:hypothetical protein